MSTRSYRGNRGKNVYEIANFSKGVNATNAAMPPGYLKELVNMNISPDGLSLRPREPYLNYALYLKREDEDEYEFVEFSNRVGMFVSKQFPNWEFIIDFFGKRHGYEKEIKDYRIIDGDTFVDNKTGIKYRLLIVDAYELGTEKGQQAKNFVETITNGEPITVRYDSQAPSWVDKYNRHLVWAYTKEGSKNIQRALIENEYAKYLDLRVTEHEGKILETQFDGLEDYEKNTLKIEDFPGGIPTVYRRDIKKEPQIIDGRPAYVIHEFNNIFMGDMLNDLEIGYSFVPNIKINKVNSEFGRYKTEYNPLEQNKMTNHDGIVALIDTNPYLPTYIIDPIYTHISLVSNLVYSTTDARSFSSSLEVVVVDVINTHAEEYDLNINLEEEINYILSDNVGLTNNSLMVELVYVSRDMEISQRDFDFELTLKKKVTYNQGDVLSLEENISSNVVDYFALKFYDKEFEASVTLLSNTELVDGEVLDLNESISQSLTFRSYKESDFDLNIMVMEQTSYIQSTVFSLTNYIQPTLW